MYAIVVAREMLAQVERNVAELAGIEEAQERAIKERVPLDELQRILALKKGGRNEPRK